MRMRKIVGHVSIVLGATALGYLFAFMLLMVGVLAGLVNLGELSRSIWG